MRFPGCRIKWNVERAKEMWCAGVRVREIAAELHTSESAINGASIRWGWPPRIRPVGATKRSVLKRCPNCLAQYRAPLDERSPHCNKQNTLSIYEAFAA